MKTLISTITTLGIVVLLLTQCNKADFFYDLYFYTNMDSADVTLSIYLDDEFDGEIPYLSTDPTCDNDTLKQQSLLLTVQSGKYDVVAKDAQGNIKASGEIKVGANGYKYESQIGKIEATTMTVGNDHCMVIGLNY